MNECAAIYRSAASACVESRLTIHNYNTTGSLFSACAAGQVRPEAAYLYDAVWIYARAAHQVLKAGLDPSDGTLVMEYIKGTTYRSEFDMKSKNTMRATVTCNA